MNNIDILEELKPEKMDLIQLIRTFKREGIENFITIRREKFENLIAENKELKEKNKELEEEDVKIRAKFILQLDNYIPKSKVEEEIQELKNMKVDGEIFKTAVNYAIKILQSLLGKE